MLRRYIALFLSAFTFYSSPLLGNRGVVSNYPMASEKIILLPHQQKVVDYFKQNQDVRGLLIYHALGAGKTVTSLAVASSEDYERVIVLLPPVLKAHWQNEISKFGFKKNIELFSMQDSSDIAKLSALDLSKSLVVVDEVQRLIEKVRYSQDAQLLEFFWKLGKAKRLLALSGTPIYNDATDLAFVGNLLMGYEKFPFHYDEFKKQYMVVDTSAAFFRGHLTESKLLAVSMPVYATMVGVSLIFVTNNFWAFPLVAMGGSSVLNSINEHYPVEKVSFRQFDARKLEDFVHKHVSYYEATEQDFKDYPTSTILRQRVQYTPSQVRFYMDFIDGVLKKEDLDLLLRDVDQKYTEAMKYVNSARIQQDILLNPNSGRDIGNLTLTGENGTEVPVKFAEIIKHIGLNKGKSAIYSSYYQNGILELAKYLRDKKLDFRILEPNLSVNEINQLLKDFNSDAFPILLIHPEITEGISLKGVEQFHILEPVKNIALEKQLIGRSIRYQSHSHLPKERQHVDVFLWETSVEYSNMGLPTEAGLVRRQSWRERYWEVNPNLWTNGILQLDRTYLQKENTPDENVVKRKNYLYADMESFKKVSKDLSIEAVPQESYQFEFLKIKRSNKDYATPLLYFTHGKHKDYTIKSRSRNVPLLDVSGAKSFDFGVEIPHNDLLNVGFTFRFVQEPAMMAGATKRLIEDGAYPGYHMDLGLYTRVHHEPLGRLVSGYWRNELSSSVVINEGIVGLGLGTRQSVGLASYINKFLGFHIEAGYDLRYVRNTMAHYIDEEADKYKGDSEAEYFFARNKSFKDVTQIAPFVAFGLFSNYF